MLVAMLQFSFLFTVEKKQKGGKMTVELQNAAQHRFFENQR